MRIASKLLFLLIIINITAYASPEEDLELFRDHFQNRFPGTEFSDFNNGVYSIDPASREQWESIEDFPPYEINIEQGEELFNMPFKNGNTYANCFENAGTIRVEAFAKCFDSQSSKASCHNFRHA